MYSTTTKGQDMKAIIRAVKMGIGVARIRGIRAGIRTGRHFYHWAPRTRW